MSLNARFRTGIDEVAHANAQGVDGAAARMDMHLKTLNLVPGGVEYDRMSRPRCSPVLQHLFEWTRHPDIV